MNDKDSLIKVFTGREIQALALKAELEENGISSIIKNDYEAGMSAGFASGTAPEIEVYVNENDVAAAKPIVNGFVKSNV